MSDRYTMHLGDCRDVLRSLPDASVDAVIADPPYGIIDDLGEQKRPDGSTRKLSWDWDRSESVRESVRVLKRPGNAFWFCGFDTAEIARDELRSAGMTVRPWVWCKAHPPPPAPGNRWPSAFELACFGFDSGAYFGDANGSRRNVLVADALRAGNQERAGHPTQKPLRVMQHLIAALTKEGDIVLDPFAGSGSTGVAALRMGRNYIGIELNPEYHAIAMRRLAEAARQGDLFHQEATA